MIQQLESLSLVQGCPDSTLSAKDSLVDKSEFIRFSLFQFCYLVFIFILQQRTPETQVSSQGPVPLCGLPHHLRFHTRVILPRVPSLGAAIAQVSH